MAYMDALLPVDKERYINKLNSIGLDSSPYVIKDWTLRSEMVSVPVFREEERFLPLCTHRIKKIKVF